MPIRLAIILAFLFISLNSVFAVSPQKNPAEPLGSAGNPIRVGVSIGKPFAYMSIDTYKGLSVDVWRRIASQYGWSFEFVGMGENVESGINALIKKNIDVLIGPVSVNYDRLKRVDFSRPYFINKIGLVTPHASVSYLRFSMEVLKEFIKPFALIVFLVFLFLAHIFWFLERKQSVSNKYFRGILHSSWILCMHIVGYSYKGELRSFSKKIFATFWFVCAFILVIFFKSMFTALLTTGIMTSSATVNTLRDIEGKRVAYVAGRQNINFIKQSDGIPVAYQNLDLALQELNSKNGVIDVVIEDYFILKNKMNKGRFSNLTISPLDLGNDEFAYVLPLNSPLFRMINLAMVKLQDDGDVVLFCGKYFSQEDILNCNL